MANRREDTPAATRPEEMRVGWYFDRRRHLTTSMAVPATRPTTKSQPARAARCDSVHTAPAPTVAASAVTTARECMVSVCQSATSSRDNG